MPPPVKLRKFTGPLTPNVGTSSCMEAFNIYHFRPPSKKSFDGNIFSQNKGRRMCSDGLISLPGVAPAPQTYPRQSDVQWILAIIRLVAQHGDDQVAVEAPARSGLAVAVPSGDSLRVITASASPISRA